MPNYNTSIEDMHDAYLATCKMRLPMRQKCRILTEILVSHVDAWKVIGITKDAFEIFAKHDFKRISRMGVNRAHLRDRADLYTEMINDPMENIDEWWKYYCENDKTVFATVEENTTGIDMNNVIWFDSQGLFPLSGFAWRHNKQEIAFLEELYEKQKNY